MPHPNNRPLLPVFVLALLACLLTCAAGCGGAARSDSAGPGMAAAMKTYLDGHPVSALSEFQRLHDDPHADAATRAEAGLFTGRCLLADAKNERALRVFRETAAANQDDVLTALAMAGEAESLTRMGQPGQAAARWDALIHDRAHCNYVALDTALYQNARCMENQGQPEAAARLYRELVDKFKKYPSPHLVSAQNSLRTVASTPTKPSTGGPTPTRPATGGSRTTHTNPSPSAPSGTYYVQVAAVSDGPNLKRAEDQLRGMGYTTSRKPGPRNLIFLRVGPWRTSAEASAEIGRLEGAGFKGCFPTK